MVKSPKSGRELESQKEYKGPTWLAAKVRRKLGGSSNNDSEE
jgi:hypothetical protein